MMAIHPAPLALRTAARMIVANALTTQCGVRAADSPVTARKFSAQLSSVHGSSTGMRERSLRVGVGGDATTHRCGCAASVALKIGTTIGLPQPGHTMHMSA